MADVHVADDVNTNDGDDSEVDGAAADQPSVAESVRDCASLDGPSSQAAEPSISDSQFLSVQTPRVLPEL